MKLSREKKVELLFSFEEPLLQSVSTTILCKAGAFDPSLFIMIFKIFSDETEIKVVPDLVIW